MFQSAKNKQINLEHKTESTDMTRSAISLLLHYVRDNNSGLTSPTGPIVQLGQNLVVTNILGKISNH